MKVKVVRSFSAFVNGEMVCASEGQTLESPAGADWVRSGLAVAVDADEAAKEGEAPVAVETPEPESASIEPSEKAVVGKPRGRVMGSKTLRGE